MQEQKYRYFIDGKEVDNRTDYLNATMSGDYVSYFNDDSVFSVSFSNFFAENTDNNKMIKREVNGHLSDILDLGQIKGNSTRHKSRNGEAHKELTIEEKLKIAEGLKKEALKQLTITLDDIKTQSSPSYYTSPEKKEEIKADWIDFIGCGIKRGKTINYENSAEKENKEQSSKTEENLVFQKDSEIHKEELKPDFSFTGTPKEINDAVSEGVSEGVKRNNEGVKESQTTEKAPVFTYCKVNKNALEALSLRALYGHKKYEEENDWENFSRVPNGDFEYSNAMFRHALEIGGEEDEKEHLISSAWNAISRLEIYLRKNLHN